MMNRRVLVVCILLGTILLATYPVVRGDSFLVDKTDHMATSLSCDVYPPYINFTYNFHNSTLPPEEGWYEFVRGYMVITISKIEAVYLEVSNCSYIDLPIRMVIRLNNDIILNTTLDYMYIEVIVASANDYDVLNVCLTMEDCNITSRVIYIEYDLDFYLCYTWNFTAHMEPDVIRYVPTLSDYFMFGGLFVVMILVCVGRRVKRYVCSCFRCYGEARINRICNC